jgi:hypothetical protein
LSTANRLSVAAGLFVVVATFFVLQAIFDQILRHAFDMTWPDHARFHLTWGVANQVGFSLAAVAIALIPLRKGERWSWWVLLLWVLLGYFSLFAAWLWHGSGPRPGFEIPLGVIAIALLTALGLSFRVAFPQNRGS